MSGTATTTITEHATPAQIRWLLILGCAALVLGVYWPATSAFVELSVSPLDDSSRHIPLIALVSAWLVYQARSASARATLEPSKLGLALLFACSMLWVVSWRAGLQDPALLLMPALIWLLVFASMGLPVARTVLFPIAFLYFAVPAWTSLDQPLQVLTAKAVGVLANLIGIKTTVEGTLLHIPAGTFEIANGCSGEHYLVVGLAVAALTGELEEATFRRRVILLASMAACTIVCNWLRVLTIIVAGQETAMRHPLVTHSHYWLGWTYFAIVVSIYSWIAARTAKPLPPSPVHADSAGSSVKVQPMLAAAVVLVMLPLVSYVASAAHAGAGAIDATIPNEVKGWTGPFKNTESPWQPHFVGADAIGRAVYVDGSGRAIELAHIVYRTQKQGAELVNWSNSLMGSSFDVEAESIVTSGTQRFRETLARDAHDKHSLVWSVYEIGDGRFVRPLASQLSYGVRSVFGSPQSALLAVRVPCESKCDDARRSVALFMQAIDSRPSH